MIINDTEVGDKRLTTEWNPYNPRILDEIDDEITLKGISTLDEFNELMTSRVYGYTSSIEKYLKLDPETAQEQLLDWMHHKDELTYLHWLWRIISQYKPEDNTIAWQMPEDTVKSFNIMEHQEDVLSMNNHVLLYSKMDVISINDYALGLEEDKTTYTLYSLKAIALFFLSCLTKKHGLNDNNELTISYKDMCQIYVENMKEYENLLSLPDNILIERLVSEGYLTTGKHYTLSTYGVDHSTFFEKI